MYVGAATVLRCKPRHQKGGVLRTPKPRKAHCCFPIPSGVRFPAPDREVQSFEVFVLSSFPFQSFCAAVFVQSSANVMSVTELSELLEFVTVLGRVSQFCPQVVTLRCSSQFCGRDASQQQCTVLVRRKRCSLRSRPLFKKDGRGRTSPRRILCFSFLCATHHCYSVCPSFSSGAGVSLLDTPTQGQEPFAPRAQRECCRGLWDCTHCLVILILLVGFPRCTHGSSCSTRRRSST